MAVAETRATNQTTPHLRAEAGKVIGLFGPVGGGLTRLGMYLLSEHAHRAPVAVVDVRGWVSPLAAWEVGIAPHRLVVVRSPDKTKWTQVVAALVGGLPGVYAEVPIGVTDQQVRRLAALNRSRGGVLILRPHSDSLPAGVSFLSIRSESVDWTGLDRGHGALCTRTVKLRAWGKGVGGTDQVYEMRDNGTNALYLVAGLAAPETGRAVG